MEAKINIAAILKDKSQGVKLYSRICGAVELKEVLDVRKKKSIVVKELNSSNQHRFWHDGNFFRAGECVLQPSKEMADWSKFAWKKGDVLITDSGFVCIFKEWASDDYTKFNGCYSNSRDGYEDVTNAETAKFDKLDNNIAYGYIREIERKLGGILNLTTLEIEKWYEFKDGDIAFADYGNRQYVFIVSGKTGLSEGYSSFIFLDLSSLILSMTCRTTFFKKDICKLRLATEEEKKQLFSALEKKGERWDAEKKQIVDLKPKFDELKPFDKVLVKHQKTEEWRANIFSHTDKTDEYLDYVCVNGRWEFCIPYIGNESLLGTTKDVEDRYD